AEVLAQQQAEEAIRRETDRRADEIVRKMAENKPDPPERKTEQAVRATAGPERQPFCLNEREPHAAGSVLRRITQGWAGWRGGTGGKGGRAGGGGGGGGGG
ncbi:hypothetical protein, partial [Escherichia coli]|uniref:hypothetical protein n=1 Tax=Escherichia coli TaxID=562 RepID=UPI00258931EF